MGYYLVYVPRGYGADGAWPAVFFYHGLGGQPQTELLRDAVDGEGTIIVGMGYYAAGMEGYQYLKTRDVEILEHVLGELEGRLSIDPRRVFVSGFSKGGFYASALLNERPDLLAGAVILGAGARTEAADPKALAGKHVFIGCGDADPFGEDAVSAVRYYCDLGCKVTYERWRDTGHKVSDENTVGRWLMERAYGGRARPAGAGAKAADTALRGKPMIVGVGSAVAAAGVVLWCLCRRKRDAPPHDKGGPPDGPQAKCT